MIAKLQPARIRSFVASCRQSDLVAGGGQAALAAGYYLQRANRDRLAGQAPLRFVLLDQQLSATQVFGGALVLVGIAIVQRRGH